MAFQLLSLSEAAAVVPGRPHASAVWRWARKGALARSGARIYLKHYRIGRALYVDEGDLFAFFTELAEADRDGLTDSAARPKLRQRPRSDKHGERAAAAAAAELRARGL